MPNPPQNVQVMLTPVMTGNSATSWQMTVNGKAEQPGQYPALHIDSGNKADFTFSIANPPGQHIIFVALLTPAEGQEIHNVKGLQTDQLTFQDHNWNKGPVPYEILFSSGAAKLDPIIDNDGGGPHLQSYALLIGLAVAALFAVFAVGAMMKKRNKA